MDVTIVTVNYKLNSILAACLESLYGSGHGVAFETIVIDNESDGSLKVMLGERFSDAVIVENEDNAGFAKACNQGALMGTGRYVLYLNPDTEMLAGTLKSMVEFMDSNPQAGICGPMTVNTDGSLEPSIYNFPSISRTLVDVLYLDGLFPRLQGYERKYFRPEPVHEPVEVICGACLMARRELLDRLGHFDDELWMYGEDVELCYRFRKAGYRSIYLKDCRVVHKRGEKHLDEETEYDMSLLIYWHYRWIFHFHEKHSNPAQRFIMSRLLYLNIISKYVPRKKKLVSGRDASKNNSQRVAAFERLLQEYYGKKI